MICHFPSTGPTNYHRGPQRTTEDHRGHHRGPQRTPKDHRGPLRTTLSSLEAHLGPGKCFFGKIFQKFFQKIFEKKVKILSFLNSRKSAIKFFGQFILLIRHTQNEIDISKECGVRYTRTTLRKRVMQWGLT